MYLKERGWYIDHVHCRWILPIELHETSLAHGQQPSIPMLFSRGLGAKEHLPCSTPTGPTAYSSNPLAESSSGRNWLATLR